MPTFALGHNQYGKAETRIVRVTRGPGGDGLTDLNVSVALRGDLAASHLTGDNSAVLPTDTQKNTVYAFAREHGIDDIESFATRLARHFVGSQPSIHGARVTVEQYPWQPVDGAHTFRRDGGEVRTATVHHDAARTQVVSGITGLVLLKTTDSEFHGFVKDAYTTLPETRDRILATSVNATWRHDGAVRDDYATARAALLDAFAGTYSLALQQTLYAMGAAVLAACPGVVEVKLSLPNRHHFLVDLAPFGLDNPNEVYYAADRPYGLIEGTVRRDDDVAEEVVWSF
ncbi:urate oxidase [Dactylosporangium aurantiacum]|uniref:Uricase n=1 Tax=Dactylosporangium aurantiacum TaxID=35754 RepID=A0A9Q9IKV4_9ACTN|nr:urate oxidase [Dactylosporangium aurantiacum]MDG6104285.1 urate oxidase [Dactylosporangium aurantiacum]UWZ56718.1 urate oxidase [Dactylosporangium aurantiacum]